MNIKRKNILIILSILLFSAFGILAVHQNSVDTGAAGANGTVTTKEELGHLNHYNGVLFKNFSVEDADVEGALAVGGDYFVAGIAGGKYDVGGAWDKNSSQHNNQMMGSYHNDQGYPSLFLNTQQMELRKDGNGRSQYNIYGGKAVFSESLYEKYNASDVRFSAQNGYQGEYTAADSLADSWFEDNYNLAKEASQQYLEAGEVEIPLTADGSNIAYGTGSYYNYDPEYFRSEKLGNHLRGVDTDNILIITVRSGSNVSFTAWNTALSVACDWAQEYDLVIYNFPDIEEAQFPTYMSYNGFGSSFPNYQDSALLSYHGAANGAKYIAQRQAACQKVIWNFPNAEKIEMPGLLLWGTLLAPDAEVIVDGGSINGQLIAGSLTATSGFELHAFKLSDFALDVVEYEEEYTADVTITKYLYYNREMDMVLEGAEFDLLYFDESEAAYIPYSLEEPIITDELGRFTIPDLPEGSYLLEETAPPVYGGVQGLLNDSDAGLAATYYQYEFAVPGENEDRELLNGQSDDYYFIDNNDTIQIRRYNAVPLFDVIFYKRDEQTSEGLEGASFYLDRLEDEFYPASRMNSNIESDEDGVIHIPNLLFGTYHMVEKEAPDGYDPGGDIYFEIAADGTVTGLEGFDGETVWNSSGAGKYKVVVFKYDSDNTAGNEKGLSGAAFEMYCENEQGFPVRYETEVPIITDVYGTYTLEDLPAGIYYLVETAAPDGYIISNPYQTEDGLSYAVEFEIEEKTEREDEIADWKNGYYEVAIGNERNRTAFEIKKVCSYSGEYLANAEFYLYQITGSRQLISSGRTDGEGSLVFTDLEAGTYELLESSTPEGYQPPAESIQFTVDFDENGEAVFRLLQNHNNAVFEVDSNAENVWILNIQNDPYLSSLRVLKRDSETYQEGISEYEEVTYVIKYLENAVFQLQRLDENSGEYKNYGEPFGSQYIDGETDANGNAVAAAEILDGLTAGRYQIIEVQVPDGYEDAQVGTAVGSFQIRGGQETVTITIANTIKAARSEIKVQKVDRSTAKGIEGAEFILWSVDEGDLQFESTTSIAEVLAAWDQLSFQKYADIIRFVSGQDGWFSLGSLKPGLYALYESEPPEDYLYVLEPHSTRLPGEAETVNLDFYYHLTAFRVIAIDENDLEAGVRIAWVHNEKLVTDEARYNNVLHDTTQWQVDAFGNSEEAMYESPDAYRAFRITNRKLTVPEIVLKKVDSKNGEALKGAEFTLTAIPEDAPEGAAGAALYSEYADTFLSGENGEIEVTIPETYTRKVVYSQLNIGKFMLAETGAPPGYQAGFSPIYFELVVNPLTKAVDMYLLDEQGGRTGTCYPGYQEPENQGEPGVYSDSFDLGQAKNARMVGQFTIRKELEKAAAEDEIFLFSIASTGSGSDEIFYGMILIEEGQKTGTIRFDQIPAGTYEIAELKTNWRYTISEEEKGIQTLVIDSADAAPEVIFTNRKVTDQWLSDQNSVTNIMEPMD